MKINKILSLIIIVILIATFSACSDNNKKSAKEKKEKCKVEQNAENEVGKEGYTQPGRDYSKPLPVEDTDVDYNSLFEPVNSSCFSEVGYDPNSETLYVRFLQSGSVYSYSEFTEDEFDEFINSPSLGRYYNYNIKGLYPCERLE